MFDIAEHCNKQAEAEYRQRELQILSGCYRCGVSLVRAVNANLQALPECRGIIDGRHRRVLYYCARCVGELMDSGVIKGNQV